MDTEQATVPYGYCHCGCGGKTRIAPRTFSHLGHRKGQPQPYIFGHDSTRPTRSPRWDVDETTGCWNWLGRLQRNGYAKLWNTAEKRAVWAHRYIYERAKGPIPESLELDHLCRNPRCVNPDHLEPVTRSENQRRGRDARPRSGSVSLLPSGRWRAGLQADGERHHVGVFPTEDMARAALDDFIASRPKRWQAPATDPPPDVEN